MGDDSWGARVIGCWAPDEAHAEATSAAATVVSLTILLMFPSRPERWRHGGRTASRHGRARRARTRYAPPMTAGTRTPDGWGYGRMAVQAVRAGREVLRAVGPIVVERLRRAIEIVGQVVAG